MERFGNDIGNSKYANKFKASMIVIVSYLSGINQLEFDVYILIIFPVYPMLIQFQDICGTISENFTERAYRISESDMDFQNHP